MATSVESTQTQDVQLGARTALPPSPLLSNDLPKIAWGRPSVPQRGNIAALGNEIAQLEFSSSSRVAPTRSFDTLPVFCFSTAKGLGDLASAVSLASALKRAYPEKQIELILVDGLSPRPALATQLAQLESSGVRVLKLSTHDAMNYSNSRVVAIQGIIPHTKDGGGSEFTDQMGAGLNIYVPEYDPGFAYWNPTGMGLDRLCRDRSDRFHIALTSGFGSGALGLFFNEVASSRTPSMNREELLAALEIHPKTALWKRIMASDWTTAYRNGYGLREERLAYALGDARGAGALKRAVTVLDFTNFDDWSINYHEKHLDHPSVKHGESGIYVRPLTYYNENFCPIKVDSQVVRLGRRSSDIYAAALRLAQLPVEITGDSSLTEAVALGLPFFYDAPPWKWNLQSQIVTHSMNALSLSSADTIRGLIHNYQPHDPANFEAYQIAEKVYLEHRDEFREIRAKYNSSIRVSEAHEAMMSGIRFILSSLVPVDRNQKISMAISTATNATNDLAHELWLLKRSIVLDTDYRSMDNDEKRRFEIDFVSNPSRWIAFQELGQDARKNLDFATNLRPLIDGLVARHGLAT